MLDDILESGEESHPLSNQLAIEKGCHKNVQIEDHRGPMWIM